MSNGQKDIRKAGYQEEGYQESRVSGRRISGKQGIRKKDIRKAGYQITGCLMLDSAFCRKTKSAYGGQVRHTRHTNGG